MTPRDGYTREWGAEERGGKIDWESGRWVCAGGR